MIKYSYPPLPLECRETAIRLQKEIAEIYTEKTGDDSGYFHWNQYDGGIWEFKCNTNAPPFKAITLENLKIVITNFNFLKNRTY